jgi:hypothetical protein
MDTPRFKIGFPTDTNTKYKRSTMNSLKYLENENEMVKVDHLFTFKLGDKLDKPIRRAVESGLDIASHYAVSFRFIAMGIAAYFVLSGASKLVDSIRGNSGSRGGSSSNSSKSSSSSKSSKPKS